MGSFEIGPLESLGLLLLCGYFSGRIANRLRFPRVTGYIAAGILLSPSVSGVIPAELTQTRLSIINDIALAVIAFSIGGSLIISKLKLLGKKIFIINLTEALGAFCVTFTLLALLSPFIFQLNHFPGSSTEVYLPFALIIAAVSAATAPAAILAIVHEYKARGPLTTTLLGVVALDDAMAIILYAFASTAVQALTQAGGPSLYKMAAEPALTILGSIALGALMGFLLSLLAPWVNKKESRLIVLLGTTFLCSGIAAHLGLSPLLACMMVGLLVANTAKHSGRLFQALEDVEEPIFVLFFSLAGAHFDFTVIKTAGAIGFLILLCRFAGKFFGTRLGAALSHAPSVVKRYLGYGLLPSAGVTLGLIFMARSLVQPPVFEMMVNAVLASVILNELVAPPLVKYALKAAGEGVEANRENKRHS